MKIKADKNIYNVNRRTTKNINDKYSPVIVKN